MAGCREGAPIIRLVGADLQGDCRSPIRRARATARSRCRSCRRWWITRHSTVARYERKTQRADRQSRKPDKQKRTAAPVLLARTGRHRHALALPWWLSDRIQPDEGIAFEFAANNLAASSRTTARNLMQLRSLGHRQKDSPKAQVALAAILEIRSAKKGCRDGRSV
jgi:hypothetical protein